MHCQLNGNLDASQYKMDTKSIQTWNLEYI